MYILTDSGVASDVFHFMVEGPIRSIEKMLSMPSVTQIDYKNIAPMGVPYAPILVEGFRSVATFSRG